MLHGSQSLKVKTFGNIWLADRLSHTASVNKFFLRVDERQVPSICLSVYTRGYIHVICSSVNFLKMHYITALVYNPLDCRAPQREDTNLAVRVLGWQGVASTSVPLQECNLSHLRSAICHASGMQARVWLVHKHPSRLEMQLKVLVYKKCVHVRKFVVPSAVAALAISLSKNCDESKEERARRLTRKWKRRQRDKRQSLTHEVHSEMDEYDRAASSKAKSGCLEKRLYPRVW